MPAPEGSGAEVAVQVLADPVRIRPWLSPVASSYVPTAVQEPPARQVTDSTYPSWCVPVPAPEGSGARVAVQVEPDSVSINPCSWPVASSYHPTAVQVPLAGQETDSR